MPTLDIDIKWWLCWRGVVYKRMDSTNTGLRWHSDTDQWYSVRIVKEGRSWWQINDEDDFNSEWHPPQSMCQGQYRCGHVPVLAAHWSVDRSLSVKPVWISSSWPQSVMFWHVLSSNTFLTSFCRNNLKNKRYTSWFITCFDHNCLIAQQNI